MRHFVWAAIVALAICAYACGGSPKQPMVPDQPGDPTLVGDGGAMPAPAK